MKVLFLCPFVPWPLTTGGKIRTYNLLRCVADRAEVHLAAVRDPDAGPEAVEALERVCASVELFERTRPGPLARWSRPKLERWFHSPGLRAHVERELAAGDFDLVHLDEMTLARAVPPALSVPVVQHHHKLDTVLYENLTQHHGPQRHFDLWKLHRLERESARRFERHVLCSEEDAEILRTRHGVHELDVVPSGFDPAYHRPSSPPVERRPDELLFLGSMDYGPNVNGVVGFVRRILPRVRELAPGTRLSIVGRDPAPEVHRLASDEVDVVGGVPDVRPHLERAAALVVPLRIGGGTRLKIVEALALSTPTVSTRIGAEGLGLTDREHLRLADDAEAFARAVVDVLEDPAGAAEMADRGRTYVDERYRWDVLAEGLVASWQRAIASR